MTMINSKNRAVQYAMDAQNGFTIEGYLHAKPFSSFLPAVAGPYGVPLWAYYVNRGQGIACFGLRDKDHAIQQFYPANRAYEFTQARGFRTFIKLIQKKGSVYYEPFQNSLANQAHDISNRMRILPGSFALDEKNISLGLATEVSYFGIPNEYFAALARKLVITNTSGQPVDFEVIDGLPVLVPFGLKEFFLKDMCRTVEAWMSARIVEKTETAAFYQLKADPEDRPEFEKVDGAHFYTSFAEGITKDRLVNPILYCDPSVIFGAAQDFSDPRSFLEMTPFLRKVDQMMHNKTPCAFSGYRVHLEPGQSVKVYSYIGEAKDRSRIEADLGRIVKTAYFEAKARENAELIESLSNPVTTVCGLKEWSPYARQTYLDNLLRGGEPYRIDGEKKNEFIHIYSRKHGDLERDYNRFVIEPSFLSQGEANYRDVNQNRRSDVWFHPQIGDVNVKAFFDLVQTDGFNPLLVGAVKFSLLAPKHFAKKLVGFVEVKSHAELMAFLAVPRSPGELLSFVEQRRIHLKETRQKFLGFFVSQSARIQEAHHGEGFWCEHWVYNTDLLESYLGVYPEKAAEILVLRKDFTFYDNAHRVRPRSAKYCLAEGGAVRQFKSVYKDEDKAKLIASRASDPFKVRTRNGKGRVYETTLTAKILTLVANKYASLDPKGLGIEMEADKPDWFDALNGLPGLLGSTVSPSFELLRLMRFTEEKLGEIFGKKKAAVAVPAEVARLLQKLVQLTRSYERSRGSQRDFVFWDLTHKAKEAYWEETRFGFKGTEKRLPVLKIRSWLKDFSRKLETALKASYDSAKEVCPTYLINEVTHHRLIKSKRSDKPVVIPTQFTQKRLPPFLEGSVHALRVERDPSAVNRIYNAVRNSELFDRKLGMYRVNASVQGESPEIGRVRLFAPGWLENQSVFLHMEYKFLLELLKRGLPAEFFSDIRTALVPFQDARVYGRSIFENSSFIASSAFDDKSLHGNGFVARLSGSTAEFLEIWLVMSAGTKPFFIDEDKKLNLRFAPILPPWFFTQTESHPKFNLKGEKIEFYLPKHSYSFVFLGQTIVNYYNPKMLATYGAKRAAPKRITFKNAKGETVMVAGDTLDARYAQEVRSGLIKRLDIELG